MSDGKRQSDTTMTSKTMSRLCGTRALSLASLFLGLLASGTLSLAVATDYWIFTAEPVIMHPDIFFSPNSSLNMSGFQLGLDISNFPASFDVRTNLGLWRACVEREEGADAEDFPPRCKVIGYTGQDYERREGASTTSSILRAIRRATPVIVVSLLILLVAVAFSTVGNAKGDIKTFIGAVLYIVAALNLAVGVIIYISQVNDEVSHRKKPHSSEEEGFRYHYGWAFFFAGASFVCAMIAAVVNVSIYLRRYSSLEDMIQIIPGLEKRGPFSLSRCVTQDTMESTGDTSSRASSRRSSMRMSRGFSGLPQNPTIIL